MAKKAAKKKRKKILFRTPPKGCRYERDVGYIEWFSKGQNVCNICPLIVLGRKSACEPGVQRLKRIEALKGRK